MLTTLPKKEGAGREKIWGKKETDTIRDDHPKMERLGPEVNLSQANARGLPTTGLKKDQETTF